MSSGASMESDFCLKAKGINTTVFKIMKDATSVIFSTVHRSNEPQLVHKLTQQHLTYSERQNRENG